MVFKDFEASRAVIDLKVIDLPGQEVLLAGFVSHVNVSFPSESGWVLNGPGNRVEDGKGQVLMGFYPRPTTLTAGRSSLDRVMPTTSSTGAGE